MAKLIKSKTQAILPVQHQALPEHFFQTAIQSYSGFQYLESLEDERFSPELIHVMSKIEFFSKSCPQDLTLETFTERCMRFLKYEYFPAGNAVFHLGERGEKFYIVLSGACDVYIPRKETDILADEEKILTVLRSFPNIEEQLYQFFIETKQRETDKPIDEKTLRKAYKKLNISPQEIDKLSWMHILGFKYFTRYGVLRYFKVAQLRAGKSFGEVALNSAVPRTASIIASEDTVLLSLTKSGYNQVFQAQIRAYKERQKFITEALKSIGVGDVPEVLTSQFKDVTFVCNHILWREDDFADCFLILSEGSVTVSKKIDSISRKSIQICQLQSGAMIGHVEFFNQTSPNLPRQTTCTANQNSKAYMITSDFFKSMIKQYPKVIAALKINAKQFEDWVEKRIQQVLNAPQTEFQQIKNQQSIRVLSEMQEKNIEQILKSNKQIRRHKTSLTLSKGQQQEISVLNKQKVLSQLDKNPAQELNIFEILENAEKRKPNQQIKEHGRTFKKNVTISHDYSIYQNLSGSLHSSLSSFTLRVPNCAKQLIREIAKDSVKEVKEFFISSQKT